MKKQTVKYTRGPSMKGVRVMGDFLPPPHLLIKKARPQKISVQVDPFDLQILEKEAARRHKPHEEFLAGILRAYAETLR